MQKKVSGQVLLVVLLSMAVILTVILSIYSRSVTDIAVTSQEQDAARAFSAAEAGIENALISCLPSSPTCNISLPSTLNSGASVTGNVTALQASKQYVYPIDLPVGETGTIWFVTHNGANESLYCDSTTNDCFKFVGNNNKTFKACWGNPGTPNNLNTTPALEISLYYDDVYTESAVGDYSDVKIARAAYDPFTTRSPASGFSAPDTVGNCIINGKNFAFWKTVDVSTITGGLQIPGSAYKNEYGLLFLRFRLFYNTDQNQPFGVNFTETDLSNPNNALPSQGRRFDAAASAGSANRRVELYQLYSNPPGIFDASVFSPSSLVHF